MDAKYAKFSEYVEVRDHQLEEGFWDAAKGAVAGIGHTPLQFARGAGKTAYGLGQMGVGAVRAGAGALSGLDSNPKGWSNARAGAGQFFRGAGNVIRGATQAATAPIAGLGRGILAANQQGFGKPEAQPGLAGGFKQFMGWAKSPSGNITPAPSQPAQNQNDPRFAGMSPQARAWYPPGTVPSQTTPQQPPQAQPVAPPSTMNTQRDQFFKNNPGFNRQGAMQAKPQAQPSINAQPMSTMDAQRNQFFKNNPGFNQQGAVNQTTQQTNPRMVKPANPSQVNLQPDKIDNLARHIMAKRWPNGSPNGIDTLLKVLKTQKNHTIDWNFFDKICRHYGVSPSKLYKSIS